MSNKPKVPLDDKSSIKALKELAEKRLQSQLQLATGSDQRSMALATICATLTAGAIAAGAGLWVAGAPGGLVGIFLIFGTLIFVALIVAVFAAMPLAIIPPGVSAEQFNGRSNPPKNTELDKLILEFYFEAIIWNRGCQERRLNLVASSLVVIIISLVFFALSVLLFVL